jgi:hypothetical protein
MWRAGTAFGARVVHSADRWSGCGQGTRDKARRVQRDGRRLLKGVTSVVRLFCVGIANDNVYKRRNATSSESTLPNTTAKSCWGWTESVPSTICLEASSKMTNLGMTAASALGSIIQRAWRGRPGPTERLVTFVAVRHVLFPTPSFT